MIFGHFSKCWLWHFFLPSGLSNQLNVSVVVHIYKVRIFDEVFFLLTIRVTMITMLFRVVTCYNELSPIYMHEISMECCCGGSRGKKNTYLFLIHISSFRYYTRQGANLVLEAPKHDPLIKWPTWSHMTVWKIYASTFTWFIANKLGRLLTLGRIFSTQSLKSPPTSCLTTYCFLYRIYY